MNKSHTYKIVLCAVIGALYTVMTMFLPAISYSVVQMRISEMLTVLPVFGGIFVLPLTFGCALSNLVGFLMGVNPYGIPDVFIGSLASFAAAGLCYLFRNIRIKNLPVLSVFMPVVINALVLGAEDMFILTGKRDFIQYLITASKFGLGQMIPCVVLGLALFAALDRIKDRIF